MSSPEDHESSEWQSQKPVDFRARRPHRKSRKGCFECKRRKIKCDETKPSCRRCVLSLQNCIYLVAPPRRKDRLTLPSPPCSSRSPSSHPPSDSEPSSSFDVPPRSTPASVESELCADISNFSLNLSDADLYHHYLQHTSRTLTHCQRDQGVFQIGMPTLALQNKTVFHSILALSAISMCCDMISKEPAPDPSAVSQILTAGYHHYGIASEQMREMMLKPDGLKPEPLLASSILLVPFASASQQVHYWIASRTGTKESRKVLSSTPRDIIVIMRGVRTMLQTLGCDRATSSTGMTPETDLATDSLWLSQLGTSSPNSLPPSRTHVMFPILGATIEGAFSKLQERLAFASIFPSNNSDLSACSAALELLKHIGTSAFSASKTSKFALTSNKIEDSVEQQEASPPQVAPWLRSYARSSKLPQPNEPLTRFFLTFLVQIPQTYLDLVLPLLDQRLESPINTPFEDTLPELTMEQALALDIYAHWSVLMLLVEEESWWIGNLPTVTLTGMLNRFGDDFVERSWPDYEKDHWWPGSMLNILRGINQHR